MCRSTPPPGAERGVIFHIANNKSQHICNLNLAEGRPAGFTSSSGKGQRKLLQPSCQRLRGAPSWALIRIKAQLFLCSCFLVCARKRSHYFQVEVFFKKKKASSASKFSLPTFNPGGRSKTAQSFLIVADPPDNEGDPTLKHPALNFRHFTLQRRALSRHLVHFK